MRTTAIALLAAGAIGIAVSSALAAPMNGAAILGATELISPVEQVRSCVYRGRVYSVPGSCHNKCVTATWRSEGRQWIRWRSC